MDWIVSITADPSPPETATRPGRDPRLGLDPAAPSQPRPRLDLPRWGARPGVPASQAAGGRSPCGQSAGRVSGRRVVEGFVGHLVDLGGAAELGQPRRDHRGIHDGGQHIDRGFAVGEFFRDSGLVGLIESRPSPHDQSQLTNELFSSRGAGPFPPVSLALVIVRSCVLPTRR